MVRAKAYHFALSRLLTWVQTSLEARGKFQKIKIYHLTDSIQFWKINIGSGRGDKSDSNLKSSNVRNSNMFLIGTGHHEFNN